MISTANCKLERNIRMVDLVSSDTCENQTATSHQGSESITNVLEKSYLKNAYLCNKKCTQ